MTQCDKVLSYMAKNGWITSLEATDKFKITRLSAVIHRLKKQGWPIETELRPSKSEDGKFFGARHQTAGNPVPLE